MHRRRLLAACAPTLFGLVFACSGDEVRLIQAVISASGHSSTGWEEEPAP